MQNALIYSPSLDGHRQLYVFVLNNVLHELNFSVFVAFNFDQKINNSFYIDKIKQQSDVCFIDTGIYNEGGLGISLPDFLDLQFKYNIHLTIFAEADHHLSLLISQISINNKRLKGKLAGIFLRPFYYYRPLGLSGWLRYIKHLPTEWRTDARLFHGLLQVRFPLLHKALYLDEKFVAKHKRAVWLPDVFQQFADRITREENLEQRAWIDRLKLFKDANEGRFLFLYFGTAQYRRGYDTLLQIAEELNGCFIHCGLRNKNEHFDLAVDTIRESLRKRGQLFETDQFIEDPACIEAFFTSVSHMILPYRDFLGSSGVMLQALSYGIPVLAPRAGIIGYRINKYGLGYTYDEKESGSLVAQCKSFIKLNPADFKFSIQHYMGFQNADNLRASLLQVFSDSPGLVRFP